VIGDLPPSENRKDGVDTELEEDVGVAVLLLIGESKSGVAFEAALYSFARSTSKGAGGQETKRFCAIVILGVLDGAADLTGEGGSGFMIRNTRTLFVSRLTEEESEVLLEDPFESLEEACLVVAYLSSCERLVLLCGKLKVTGID